MRVPRWMRVAMLLAALIVLGAPVALAAEIAASAAPSWSNLFPLLITAGVPVVIALGKLALGWLPGWLLPIIAPILGGLADAAIAWASGGAPNPVLGAVLGSAGVGLREIYDQAKRPRTS